MLVTAILCVLIGKISLVLSFVRRFDDSSLRRSVGRSNDISNWHLRITSSRFQSSPRRAKQDRRRHPSYWGWLAMVGEYRSTIASPDTTDVYHSAPCSILAVIDVVAPWSLTLGSSQLLTARALLSDIRSSGHHLYFTGLPPLPRTMSGNVECMIVRTR